VQRAALFLPPHVVGAPFSYENPLRVFEDLDFEVAVMDAARLYGAQPFLSEEAYHKALAAGEFLSEDIDSILGAETNATVAGRLDRVSLRRAMIARIPRQFHLKTIQWIVDETDFVLRFREDSPLSSEAERSAKGLQAEGIEVRSLYDAIAQRISDADANSDTTSRPRDRILASTGIDLDAVVLPFLIHLLRSYTGIGQKWSMPAREQGFLAATRLWVEHEGQDACPNGLKALFALFESQSRSQYDSIEASIQCMDALGVPTQHWSEFTCRKLLVLPGWASLFAYLERYADAPGTNSAPKYRVIDFLAVLLTVTVAAIKEVTPNPNGWKFAEDRREITDGRRLVTVAETFDVAQILGLSSSDISALTDIEFGELRAEIGAFGAAERRRVLHLARERGHERTLESSFTQVPLTLGGRDTEQIAMIVFCADDKEAALRRQLETASPAVQTYGVPSFVGPGPHYRTEVSFEDKVAAVSRIATLIGLDAKSPPLIVLVGHASLPDNRASDWSAHCGVCQGNCDAKHARVLADWANEHKVRRELKARGIHLPAGAWFVAVRHSNQESSLAILDREQVSGVNPETVTTVEGLLKKICTGESADRKGWLLNSGFLRRVLAPLKLPGANGAVSHRPTGHSGCSLCLIGPSGGGSAQLSDGSAFVASYNSAADESGRTLATLLEELVPACAKVNLDYFFARVDIDHYGVSLDHVTESGEVKDLASDLRAGLPWRAVEKHQPLRLVVFVQAPPDVLERALSYSPRTRALVRNNWVRLRGRHQQQFYEIGESMTVDAKNIKNPREW
jgi:uncharacterized protein YbcC (UPF0753/DUF2309 family)